MKAVVHSTFRFFQLIAGLIVLGSAAKDASNNKNTARWPELVILAFATYTTFTALVMGIGGFLRKCGTFLPFFDFTVGFLAIINGVIVHSAIPALDKQRCGSAGQPCPLKLIEFGLYVMALFWMCTAAIGFMWGHEGPGKFKKAIGHTDLAMQQV